MTYGLVNQMKIKCEIKGLQGSGMSYSSLYMTRLFQQMLDIPDTNVCFSVKEFMEKLKEAEKKERFIVIEGYF